MIVDSGIAKGIKKIPIFLSVCMIALFVAGEFFREPHLLYIGRQISTKVARLSWVSGNASVRLDVPFHRQEHSLSCEIASLKMALAGVGIHVPESELISKLKFDPTLRQGGIWGDPYKGFVGNIDGKMGVTGYGVYADPIADVGLAYVRTQTIRDGTIQHLTAHLDEGRPVVVWGHFGPGKRIDWKTPEGRPISAVNGEHARTLIGYIGDPANPETLIIIDPIYGEQRWRTSDFMRNWDNLERAAVAVYSTPRWAKIADDPTVWEISPDGKIKYALAMNWDDFVSQGGIGEGIKTVDSSWLGSLQTGGKLTALPPK